MSVIVPISNAAVVLKFLGYTPNVDFFAGEAGTDTAIHWMSLATMPEVSEIVAAELPAAKQFTIAANRVECSRRIYARYPPGRQLSALAGLYDLANVATMTDWIAANISAENTAADAIEAATTVQQVEAVTVTWPT